MFSLVFWAIHNELDKCQSYLTHTVPQMSHLCPSQQLLDVRRYNPKNDFHSALGDGDEDLDLLPPQAARGKSKLCMISRANWKALDPMHDAFPLDVAAAYRSRMPSHSWSEILRC